MESERSGLREGKLHEKAAVVIGANSSIGQTLIPELLGKYRTVILTEHGKGCLDFREKIEELKMNYPANEIVYMTLDVLNPNDVGSFETFIQNEDMEIGSFIYLAGINMLVPALEMTDSQWDRIIDVNLKGFFFTARAVAKNMIMNDGGSILGIASQHGVVANVNRAAYCASKAGMIHLVKELALEWSKYNIRVNIVSPTFILSERNQEILESSQGKREYLGKIPLRKYARSKDVSSAIMFLESEEAGIITGHNLVLDGGWTIC